MKTFNRQFVVLCGTEETAALRYDEINRLLLLGGSFNRKVKIIFKEKRRRYNDTCIEQKTGLFMPAGGSADAKKTAEKL